MFFRRSSVKSLSKCCCVFVDRSVVPKEPIAEVPSGGAATPVPMADRRARRDSSSAPFIFLRSFANAICRVSSSSEAMAANSRMCRPSSSRTFKAFSAASLATLVAFATEASLFSCFSSMEILPANVSFSAKLAVNLASVSFSFCALSASFSMASRALCSAALKLDRVEACARCSTSSVFVISCTSLCKAMFASSSRVRCTATS
mmetsp:Transcript_4812/g.10613  ORF Transcript_4812/g.10613 Transcript_4812/m.10613 type:complete len:204 (-) Transcript_4812:1494-2105(-)